MFSWSKLRSFPCTEIIPADIADAFMSLDEGATEDEENCTSTTDDESYTGDAPSDDETLDADTDTDSDEDSESSTDNEDDDDDSDGSDDDPDDDDAAIEPVEQATDEEPINADNENQGAHDDPSDQNENQGAGSAPDGDQNKQAGRDKGAGKAKASKTKSYAQAVKTKFLKLRPNTGYNLRHRCTKAKSFKRRFDRLHFQFL